MGDNASNSLPAFGFLTVLEDAQHGFFGGYLLLSELGRPLEFHCSTPVFPNDAQRILYGASLRPYVLGELIGQTLVEKAELAVQILLTDQEEMLGLALLREEPLALVSELDSESNSQSGEGTAPEFVVGNYRLHGTSTCDWQPERLGATIAPLVTYVDLAEPFDRVREAIREAQRISEPRNDHDDHASSSAA